MIKTIIIIASILLSNFNSDMDELTNNIHKDNFNISSSPDWTGEGNQPAARYSCSVSSAGDVNGDGYPDVVVSAAYYDNGQTDEGRVNVYYGSASGLPTVPSWTAESDQEGASCYSAACAGDVNGDGYSDIIAGAQFYDNGQTDEGKVFVYYGSSEGLSKIANWTAESNQAGALFGILVSSAGDVNNDGYSDVIIGSPTYDNGQTDEGRAYVYYGSSEGLSDSADWIAESDQAGAWFGVSVSKAGDVNGDGYSDVIVGAHQYTNGQPYEGRAYVYYGSATGLSDTPAWTGENDQANSLYGYSVSTAGDVNDDGYSDVIVGSYLYDHGQTDEGGAFVYYGSSSGLSDTANWTAENNNPGSRFGVSVSSAGDANGDGYSDVIVGAYRYTNGQAEEGSAYVYYGSSTGLAPVYGWMQESNQGGARYGYAVSNVGDVNKDGNSDVIVGAVNYDDGELDEGAAFIYFGSGVKTISLKVLIQGFYEIEKDKVVPDTLTVYLRNSVAPFIVVDSSRAIINTSGNAQFIFTKAFNNTPYYIQIRHRNSIETWSSSTQSFTHSLLNFDLSTSASQAYGNNLVLVNSSPLRFAVYSGDINQSGTINLTDIIAVSNAAAGFVTGYQITDVTGDNIANLSDILLTSNNSMGFVSVVRP
ncbi:MAG: integrin alpha [Ignavibacteria bacterium]